MEQNISISSGRYPSIGVTLASAPLPRRIQFIVGNGSLTFSERDGVLTAELDQITPDEAAQSVLDALARYGLTIKGRADA